MSKNQMNIRWKRIFAIFCSVLIVLTSIPADTLAAAGTATPPKTLLKNTITYCENLKKSEYTQESWTAFQKVLKASKAAYSKKNASAKSFTAARDSLEEAKADLMFTAAKETGNSLIFRALTVKQMVGEMGAGFNLGNTMDGHSSFTPSETTWQHVVTTKEYIKKMHDIGFNTIRIPVTWGNFIDDENDYTINDAWISRVQDIVDYAIAQDMYVIINIHHDGAEQTGWLRVAEENIDPIYEKFEHVWRNIATRFKDYDEHLIFEAMNEVTGGSDSTPAKDMMVINNLNQIFVNVVRSTGSNNSKRWLSVPGRYTNIDMTANEAMGFQLPADTVKNRLFVSVHEYDYAFGLVSTMATTKFGYAGADSLINKLKKMYTGFTSKGIPVILGEYGAANKNNTVERAFYYETVAKACSRYGIVACAWDGGDYDLSANPADYSMTLVDRASLKEVFPDLINAILGGNSYPLSSDSSAEIVKSPSIKKITSLTLSASSLDMTIGDSRKITAEIAPGDTNDVIVWETADATVATVYGGQVRARGLGTTTLTASSRSGSIKKEVTVTVSPAASVKPCTSISTDKDTYLVTTGSYLNITTKLKPSGTGDFVTYRSSDETVATISPLGKVVGCKTGSAIVTITASNGLSKTVDITVTDSSSEEAGELSLALNVYYSDKSHNYYGNEVGKPITINGNGQYTVVFDCGLDLSKAAKKAGVSTLTDLGAVYIKDYRVTLGKTNKSALVSCDIMYDKILVDGTALTITQKKPKSAMKASGIMDTNDPLNAWDGSFVKEITANTTDHVLNITKVKNPKKIEITFTISNLVFK